MNRVPTTPTTTTVPRTANVIFTFIVPSKKKFELIPRVPKTLRNSLRYYILIQRYPQCPTGVDFGVGFFDT